MVSKAKLYAQLDSMEDELYQRLLPHLRRAAMGSNEFVFCVGDFNPFPSLKQNVDQETEELIVLGRHILALREKLGETTQGSAAERICWYCRRWSDTFESRGNSAQALAREFLEELQQGA